MLELRQKLQRKGYPQDLLDALLEQLVADGWLSESRYCASLLRQRRQQGYGPLKIGWELSQRGIARDRVAELFAQVDDAGWCRTAREALDRRFGEGAPDSPAERGRWSGYLRRRGFTGAQIARAIKASSAGADGSDEDW